MTVRRVLVLCLLLLLSGCSTERLEVTESLVANTKISPSVALKEAKKSYLLRDREWGTPAKILIPLAEEVLRLTEKEFGKKHQNTATSLDTLGELYITLGRYKKAELLLRRALTIWKTSFGWSQTEIDSSLHYLVISYIKQRKFDKANKLLQSVLAARKSELGPTHVRVVDIMEELAELGWAQKDYANSISLLEESLKICKSNVGSRSYARRLWSLNRNLQKKHLFLGQYKKAEPYARYILNQEEEDEKKNPHPYLFSISLREFASFVEKLGNYVEAESLLRRSLFLLEEYGRKKGKPGTYGGIVLKDLAQLYEKLGRDEEAERFYRRALEKAELNDSKKPIDATAITSRTIILLNLASLYEKQNRHKEAEHTLLSLLQLYDKYPKGLVFWRPKILMAISNHYKKRGNLNLMFLLFSVIKLTSRFQRGFGGPVSPLIGS